MGKSLFKFISQRPFVCAFNSIHDEVEIVETIKFVHEYSLHEIGVGAKKYDAFMSFARAVSAHARLMTVHHRPGDEAEAEIGIDDAILIYNQVLAMKRI